MNSSTDNLSNRNFAIFGDSRLKYAHNCMPDKTKNIHIFFKKGATYLELPKFFYLIPASVKTVVIHAGINDILKYGSAEKTFLNLKELLRRASYKFPDLKIIISDIGPIGYDFFAGGEQNEFIEYMNTEVLKFRYLLKDFVKECLQFELMVCKAFHFDFLARDGLHYSRKGISNVINDILEHFSNPIFHTAQKVGMLSIQKLLSTSVSLVLDIGGSFLNDHQRQCLNEILDNFLINRLSNDNVQFIPATGDEIATSNHYPGQELMVKFSTVVEKEEKNSDKCDKQHISDGISNKDNPVTQLEPKRVLKNQPHSGTETKSVNSPMYANEVAHQNYQENLGARPKTIISKNNSKENAAKTVKHTVPEAKTLPFCQLTTLPNRLTATSGRSPFEERENRVIKSRGYYNVDDNED